MFKDTLPNQEAFFETFQHSAAQMSKAAENFSVLVEDMSRAADYLKEILACQEAADNYTQHTFGTLYKAFITPFDKYDMYQLACALDNITYSIGRVAESLVSYKLDKMPDEIMQISEMMVDATLSVQTSIELLEHLKNGEDILQLCQGILLLRRKVEKICSTALGRLFQNAVDIAYIVKVKDIYEKCMAVLDECDMASDMVSSVVLEYS